MFRYFYRIWDKFRYKYQDKSEIVAAAIYTYKGERGKDERYVYKLPELNSDILIYNFRTIDVEKIDIENISEDNPLKLVFKMAKRLLKTGVSDEEILDAKINLADELKGYDKVKNNEQVKALVDFLEYLFLIQNPELEKKYEEYKKISGGAFKMSIEEIRRLHYRQEGRQEGIEVGIEKIAVNMIKKGKNIEEIMELTELSYEKVTELQRKYKN